MADAVRSRLGWHCRRGMRELDVLLLAWLEQQFDRASAAQRAHFEALLELPDPQLQRYLLAGERPEQLALAALVDSIVGGRCIMSAGGLGGNLPRL